MPSNCTIISWKGKKEMASLLLSAVRWLHGHRPKGEAGSKGFRGFKPPSGCALGGPGSARERLRLPGWFRGSYKCRFAEVKVGRLSFIEDALL